MKIQMSLSENSRDYIVNALELYFVANEYGTHRREQSIIENKAKWKLAFVSLVQAFELLLKCGLEKINSILIYEDIDSPILNVEKTVKFSTTMKRLTNFNKNPFTEEECLFIKKCFIYRNRFIHCTVEIHTEDLKCKFAKLYALYCKGYKEFLENEFILEDVKLRNIHEELYLFLDKWTIFRGEEVRKQDLDRIKQEIEMWGKHSYFTTSTGERIERIAFGEEEKYISSMYNRSDSVYYREYCDDCGVKQGEYHLPDCDLEICPICKGQKLSCECDLFLDKEELQ